MKNHVALEFAATDNMKIFPTKDRGTGNALTATANRIFGIMAVSSALIVAVVECQFENEMLTLMLSLSLLCLQI